VDASKPGTRLAVRVRRAAGETGLEGEGWCYTLAAGGAGVRSASKG